MHPEEKKTLNNLKKINWNLLIWDCFIAIGVFYKTYKSDSHEKKTSLKLEPIF